MTPILDHVPAALLVIFRIGGLMIFGPLLSSSIIPPRVKLYLAVLLGLAVYPAVSARVVIDVSPVLDLWSLAPLVFTELLFGAAIGFMATLPLVSVQIGGLIMGQQMGLGFARFFNPAAQVDENVIGQLLFLMTMAGFILIGGLESLFVAVLNSFEHVPPPALGGFGADLGMLSLMVGLLTAAFELALRVAAPLLALIFLQTIAMGFIAKTVPQVNILSLGFPVRILAGLTIIALGLVVLDEIVLEHVDDVMNLISTWVESLRHTV
ncbi:MAG: flagellar biosynthetic protein FliR [Planctomycetes bacterium]|nr:flagellar biosynthetic protein FliR [Planctomycetota bacterium]